MSRTIPVAALALVAALTFAGCSSSSTVTPPAESAASEAPAAEETQEAPAAEVGTRENPAAIGSTITGDDWTVVINSVTLGANDAVAAANPFNEAPPAGSEYIVINYTATYTGSDADGGMPAFVQVDYVTAAGSTIAKTTTLAVAPDPAIDLLSTLYTGGSATGNIAVAVPSPVDGVLVVQPGMLADKVFVALQ